MSVLSIPPARALTPQSDCRLCRVTGRSFKAIQDFSDLESGRKITAI